MTTDIFYTSQETKTENLEGGELKIEDITLIGQRDRDWKLKEKGQTILEANKSGVISSSSLHFTPSLHYIAIFIPSDAPHLATQHYTTLHFSAQCTIILIYCSRTRGGQDQFFENEVI